MYVGGDLKALAELLRSGEATASDVRVFSGHCEWGRGQLEAQMLHGLWARAMCAGTRLSDACFDPLLGAHEPPSVLPAEPPRVPGENPARRPLLAWRVHKWAAWAAVLGQHFPAAWRFPPADPEYVAAVKQANLLPLSAHTEMEQAAKELRRTRSSGYR